MPHHDQHNPANTFYNAEVKTDPKRRAINELYLCDETQAVTHLLNHLQEHSGNTKRIQADAEHLVEMLRSTPDNLSDLDAFLLEYDLSSKEGILLMCIAEALLRIPDEETADKLIRDKLLSGNWQKHIEHSESLLVNASTWGLMLTGKVVSLDVKPSDMNSWLKKLVAKSGEPIIRAAMRQAMAILGKQFVMGQNIKLAIKRSHQVANQTFRYSFDMLGEAAMTQADADHFFAAYKHAITQLAASTSPDNPFYNKPSISVKLSALHPRYQLSQQQRVKLELSQRLLDLACLAKQHNLCLTVDAEESERLELSLDIFEAVFSHPDLANWPGLGLAVQAYQKRAMPVIQWLISLADKHSKRIPIRLVKGAYWDSEIKRAQELGLANYPVFTRKYHTDVSYQACALTLINHPHQVYPQFATHNAYTIAFIMAHASTDAEFEFQRLHGMGGGLYEAAITHYKTSNIACRVYAPVGGHKELLPYLVRRLLENGANTSFINRIHDQKTPISEIVSDPAALTTKNKAAPHTKIPLPRHLFGEQRLNSLGFNLHDESNLHQFSAYLAQHTNHQWLAQPIVNGEKLTTRPQPITSPFNHELILGHVHLADEKQALLAIKQADQAYEYWHQIPVEDRANSLIQCANRLEEHYQECLTLLILEAGKTLSDAIAEVREAIDFCRYYAANALQLFSQPLSLAGATGEQNILHLIGRGCFVCISPWNFPLAIYLGQISAALVCGNTVIAKPAGQTPLIAAFVIDMLHQSGIPKNVLHFLPGNGSVLGNVFINDTRTKGIAFTGSTDTARFINQGLAKRQGAIVPFIAETGGQNAMIVDSSALPEQVVSDVINSAFNSAGQRCSALRVLYLQHEIADKIITLLKGAMNELKIGEPNTFNTDIGPVIDDSARTTLNAHIEKMKQHATLVHQCPLDAHHAQGSFVAPTVFEIDSIKQLEQEVFGPILHIIRFDENKLDAVLGEINETGYGLTLGVHSRIESTINKIITEAHVGNIYINRNMIGAVVGVQPFGGEGLSGTGPKAGGPHYLYRFCTERTVSTNTAAVGGNTTLLSEL